jgi:hypothetical protein
MAPRGKINHPKTYWIGKSKFDEEVLVGLGKEGLISDVSKVRLPKGQETPEPEDDKAIVF